MKCPFCNMPVRRRLTDPYIAKLIEQCYSNKMSIRNTRLELLKHGIKIGVATVGRYFQARKA